MNEFLLGEQDLSLTLIQFAASHDLNIKLGEKSVQKMKASQACVQKKLEEGAVCYGINTGFGLLKNKKISHDDIQLLQKKLILSHAIGVGEPLNIGITRIILLLKAQSLAQGYSGVSPELLQSLLSWWENDLMPVIPSQGSVGASGDLAPLAHFSLPLIGEGEMWVDQTPTKVKNIANVKQHNLAAKEGLALLNGTQVSTAIALDALYQCHYLFHATVLAGALSLEGAAGSEKAFKSGIHDLRRHDGQKRVAAALTELVHNSEILNSHQNCDRVQDPYSLRCQPQVAGACWEQLRYAALILEKEANAVTDNPLVFAENNEILSGGNFHAEPVAFAADAMAIAIAELGSISERRMALLVDPQFSGLPAFLIQNAGLNSGFMIAQVTAAALASENKFLAHAASVDSIPTSCNQEDHVSMATHAAFRLQRMCENFAHIVALELMIAAQAVELRAPLKTSPALQKVHQTIRQTCAFYTEDRSIAEEIKNLKIAILNGAFMQHAVKELSLLN
jgi:histidine ammonia-lyase